MSNFLIALVIGVVAATIDVVPMIIKKLEKTASISAFVHYLILGLIIPFVDWEMAPWLKGLIIAELSAIPVMILVYQKDKRAILPIFIFAAFLGAGIGIAGAIFIN
jgi:hypothetical protein